MFKKTIILALAAIAVLAVSAPAASASWYKHHAVIQTDQQLDLTGQLKYQSLATGGIECQTDAKVKLLVGQTTANIESFTLDTTNQAKTATEQCATSGVIASCKITGFSTNATAGAPWIAHLLGSNKDTIELTTGIFQTLLEGQGAHNACNVVQQVQFKPGIMHMTISGSTCTVSSMTISGQIETQTGAKCQLVGTLNMIPGATYGTLC